MMPPVISPGTQLGPYEILAQIGAGGMGVVYQARDTRLGRAVAIKVLPSHLSAQPELRERFEREAQAISNLNHPHICTLHDVGSQDGIDYLVMEYLEGETLSSRLQRGPIPVREALKIAIDIGDALDKAHRQGVVHRDLKPANVMLTKNGAKLLDFGLAKLRPKESGPIAVSVTAMPTDAANLTAAGTILGTLQYMSPEQLEGKEADARSDIFAFGTTLYEMLTGTKAFTGKSQVSLMAAILEHDPPRMASLQPILPPALDDIVADCLIKNPEDRTQSVRDVVRQLKRLNLNDVASATSVPTIQVSRGSKAWPAAATLLLVTTAILLFLYLRPLPESPRSVIRFEVFPPKGMRFPGANNIPRFAISPDGNYIVYSAAPGNEPFGTLWIRRLDSIEATPIAGTEDSQQPFWSPDNRSIGFFADNKLKKVNIDGGAMQTVCSVPGQNFGGTWNSAGIILFGSSDTKGIQRVTATGGVPVQVTSVQSGEAAHLWPRFLPDGKHFLFQSAAEPSTSTIQVADLESPQPKTILESPSQAEFAQPDLLLFLREGTLLAQRLDLSTFALLGEPVAVAQDVGAAGNGRAGFSISQNGVLAYRASTTLSSTTPFQLVWFDRSGKQLEFAGPAGAYRGVDLSADGRQIATHIEEPGEQGDIFLMDALVPGSAVRRFTFDPARHNTAGIWSPDNRFVYYGAVASPSYALFRRDATGVQPPEKLWESSSSPVIPQSVSPDGRWLLFQQGAAGNNSLWILPLTEERKPFRYVSANVSTLGGQISPDGRWVAYTTGNVATFQIQVQSFPQPGTLFQVTTTGGFRPRWRKDGKELFYMIPGPASTLMAVPVTSTESRLEFGKAERLFDTRIEPIPHSPTLSYAVSPDGRRVLIAKPTGALTADPAQQPLNVVLNWDAPLNLTKR